jgi:hypothetical protein
VNRSLDQQFGTRRCAHESWSVDRRWLVTVQPMSDQRPDQPRGRQSTPSRWRYLTTKGGDDNIVAVLRARGGLEQSVAVQVVAYTPVGVGQWVVTVKVGRHEAQRVADAMVRCQFLDPVELSGLGWAIHGVSVHTSARHAGDFVMDMAAPNAR